ncbi:MAG: aquaporin [Candidatus Bathyarchaeia archaeon]
MSSPNLGKRCFAEFVGIALVLFIGNSSVVCGVALGAVNLYNLWAVGLIWGGAVAFAVYLVGSISGAQLNWQVTIPMMLRRKMPVKDGIAYMISQLIGAIIGGGALVYYMWEPYIVDFETKMGIVRGQVGSELSGMLFYCSSPHPAIRSAMGWSYDIIPPALYFFAEAAMAFFLVLMIFALTDERNPGRPGGLGAAVIIGLVIAIGIAIEAPIGMCAFGPVRDLGPRIWAYLMGWGEMAFPGSRGLWWVPTISTIVGGVIAAYFYDFLIRPSLPKTEK